MQDVKQNKIDNTVECIFWEVPRAICRARHTGRGHFYAIVETRAGDKAAPVEIDIGIDRCLKCLLDRWSVFGGNLRPTFHGCLGCQLIFNRRNQHRLALTYELTGL